MPTWPVVYRKVTHVGSFSIIPVQNSICRQWWRIIHHARSLTITHSVLMAWIRRNSTARWWKIYQGVIISDSRSTLVVTIWHRNRNVRIKPAIHLKQNGCVCVQVLSITNSHLTGMASHLHIVLKDCPILHVIFAHNMTSAIASRIKYNCEYQSIHFLANLKQTG